MKSRLTSHRELTRARDGVSNCKKIVYSSYSGRYYLLASTTYELIESAATHAPSSGIVKKVPALLSEGGVP